MSLGGEALKQKIKGIIEKYKSECDYFEIRIENSDEQRIVISGQEVDSISNKVEIGGNVRVLINGGWGFTSFNDIDNIDEYAAKAIKQARLVGHSKSLLAKVDPIEENFRTNIINDPRKVTLEDKVNQFKHYTKLIHDYNIEMKLGRVIYFDKVIELVFANSEETYVTQQKVDIGCNIFCISARGSDTQTQFVGLGSNNDYGVVLNQDERLKEACKIAVELLDAPKVKGGQYTVIVDPDLAGVFAHEAFGHLSEGDNVYENEQLKEIMVLGREFGPSNLNIYDSGVEGNNRGDIAYDDEGIKTEKTYLIKEGRLVGRLHSRETAGKMNERPTGNARAINYKFEPIPRMRVTCIENGDSSFEEMIKDIELGVYAVGTLGGQTSHEVFTFGAARGYMIRNGKICELVRDVSITGNVFETLKNIVAIGNDNKYINSAGGCGKAGQSPLPTSEAAPHIKIKDVIIGGDANE